ncbi:MAG: cytidylate kinase-like family protein [Acidobacteria bacterium]|nr:MAG: cytidylate kinase-like family protein [Acidobacteriota bacterium]
MFRIITLEREYGCGCANIASELANRLHWKLWDQSLTEEIARQAHVDCGTVERRAEKIDGAFYRLAKAFWRGSYERSMPLDERQTFDADCMVKMMEDISAKIAQEGNAVVVGRGAPYFLRERDDTFRVFLYAPRPEKVRRLVAAGTHPSEAEDLVDTVDRERMAFIKHYFNADWPTRSLYHLMINTVVGNEKVIATILDTMTLLQSQTPATQSDMRGVALK